MNDTPCRETAPNVNDLIARLASLRNKGVLWMWKPRDEYDKQPLRDEGKKIVEELVKRCLQYDVAPFCCVDGGDLTCTVDGIVSLNSLEYDDLVGKAAHLPAPKMAKK